MTAPPVGRAETVTAEPTATRPQSVLDAVHTLAPTIANRAAEVETARRLPRDLLDDLIHAGCFRLMMPPSHAGMGAELGSAMRVYEALARADGSVAWTVLIGGLAWCDLVGLPRATFDAIFDRPDVIVAGVFSPTGTITPAGDGYRVSGRWSFASGCEHADVLYGNCVERVVDGVPQLRISVFSPDEIRIEDTWTSLGLRGTGSHHIRVDDVVVPAERTLRPLVDAPCLDAPLARIPPPPLISLVVATVAIGIAQGALDDILAIAAEKVPLLAAAPLATTPLFHVELAEADIGLCAARALLSEAAGWVWASGVDGSPLAMEQRARVRAAGVWATAQAAAAVQTAHRCAGSSSVYADSPLQRRLRDIHTLTQHFIVKRDTLATAGSILAGQGSTVPVF